MLEKGLTRRDVLTKAVPAAAIAGVGLGALAQQTRPQGQQIPPAGATPAEPGQVMKTMAGQMYGDGQYQLPPLPYPANALEPFISAQVLQVHHDAHHMAAVKGLNEAVTKLSDVIKSGSYEQVQLDGLMRDISYNGGSHMLHSLYWTILAPPAGPQNVPSGAIAEAIDSQFGSFDQFKAFFSHVAIAAKGSGWALLTYEPISDGLAVFQVGDHDMRIVAGMRPILVLDVWEHAYYLQYQSKRADYINAWWNIVNWPAVTDLLTFFRQRNQ